MTKQHQNNLSNLKNAGLLGAIVGGVLISLPATILEASAAPFSTLAQVNPCPGIYYEEPYNSTRMVPPGCPQNAAAQRGRGGQMLNRQMTPATPTSVSQPPLPEVRSDAVARITPTNGTVDVRLKNNTNAVVSYQAIGQTDRRYLSGGEEILLQNLPTPITITAVRQDDGLIQMIPMSADETGQLEVTFEEETTLDSNQGVLRIQEDGQVFVN
ncbi:hypothetical protein MC7420_1843 [Coleofasciculus chthonoplastes PCC 7420]|uniref:Uncharacterized protein n=1 Tax=Coleofasciculus chthonoplastes PCC 7420 TaxID=118168 RepID=B4VM66_9CYAN|nr:hypothetical protein [Coleofasciculus chthonoplastes]EDX76840.1 hypothetical protein MC7420_1843 [Coleofasciculus chthonoplastes PCC 7420]